MVVHSSCTYQICEFWYSRVRISAGSPSERASGGGGLLGHVVELRDQAFITNTRLSLADCLVALSLGHTNSVPRMRHTAQLPKIP